MLNWGTPWGWSFWGHLLWLLQTFRRPLASVGGLRGKTLQNRLNINSFDFLLNWGTPWGWSFGGHLLWQPLAFARRLHGWVEARREQIIAVIKCKLVWLFVELRNTLRLVFPRPFVVTAVEFQTASGLRRRLQGQTWLVGWLVHLYYYWIPCFYLDFWRTPSKACKKRSNKCEWMKDK